MKPRKYVFKRIILTFSYENTDETSLILRLEKKESINLYL